jgi:hypothetical protein
MENIDVKSGWYQAGYGMMPPGVGSVFAARDILSNGTIEYDGHFSAWSYAEERARTLYEAKQFLERHVVEDTTANLDMKAVPPAPDNTNTDIGDTHE